MSFFVLMITTSFYLKGDISTSFKSDIITSFLHAKIFNVI
jgi:hypothetical protein